ncbi:MAG: NADP-dependent oxidoreductase [Halieaceae bacterium]|jgi:NADPH-dependent curcumin reductase CurA|nr:NADP-dependent oxidoreductase [Halieaceae bacterium]
MVTVNRSVVLARRPDGNPVEDDFRVESAELPALNDGEFLCRNHFVSLDAGFRKWMNEGAGDEVLPAMALGDPVMGLVLSEVVESHNTDYPVGTWLMARFAWQEYSISDGSDFIAVLPGELEFPPSAYMGVLGDTGMSAYFGMTELGQPEPGETVLISGAGGGVGSIAGQISKLRGAHTVGIVGSEDKARWITDTLGYDAAVIRGDGLQAQIADACPAGVDLFFDNVGGELLETAIGVMNHRGRLVLCGAVSGYGDEEPAPGPRNMFEVVTKELSIRGFMTHFRHERYDEAREQLAVWLREGKLVSPEHRLQGIESVARAYADLFAGRNFGKTVVEL